MAKFTSVKLCLLLVACVASQRSPYAGRRPIGYPEMDIASSEDALGNRFGTNQPATSAGGTTERLPVEALGDRDLVNRISRLPIDKQPFWYINWKALEDHRNNPQTYPSNQNSFVETPSNTQSNSQPESQSNFRSQPQSSDFRSNRRSLNTPQGFPSTA